jgi:exosome complex RNA-binding protein Csl4
MTKVEREKVLQDCKDCLRQGDFVRAKVLYMELVDDGKLTKQEIGEIEIWARS